MAGLLQQGMQQAAPPQSQPPQQGQRPPAQAQQQPQPPQGQPRQQPAEGQPSVDAPPEEAKAQVEAMLTAGMTYLYGDGMKPAANALKSSENPQEGMAKIIGSIMLTMFNTLQGQGVTVAPNVMMAAGINLAKAVGEMTVEVGVLPQDDPAMIEDAFMDGLARFGKLVDKQALSQAQRQRYMEMIRGLRDMRDGRQRQPSQEGRQPPQAQQAPQQPMQEAM